MSEFIVNALVIVGVVFTVSHTMYLVSPGLSDALSAWAKKREILTTHRLVEEWVAGYEAGCEMERAKQERAAWGKAEGDSDGAGS